MCSRSDGPSRTSTRSRPFSLDPPSSTSATPGLKTNLDDLRTLVAGWHEAFTGFHFEVVNVAVDGDLVAVNLIMRGRHIGRWDDIAPTGLAIEVGTMMFFRFADDQIVELWEVFDEHELRHQLSVT